MLEKTKMILNGIYNIQRYVDEADEQVIEMRETLLCFVCWILLNILAISNISNTELHILFQIILTIIFGVLNILTTYMIMTCVLSTWYYFKLQYCDDLEKIERNECIERRNDRYIKTN